MASTERRGGPVTGGYVDLVVDALADSEAELQHVLAELEADVQTYHDLAIVAVHALHDVTQERDALRRAHHRLLGEYRHLRAQIMGEAEAAA